MTNDSAPDNLETAARLVAQPWEDSPYYRDAEQWTHLFWAEGTPFKTCFDRLDMDRVLELACGHGRHSERIAPLAAELLLLDVFENNLNICRQRLDQHQGIELIKGNGYDFQPVANGSVSAVVCYDAMVHFSPDIVGSYLRDGSRILRDGGAMLLHHSNYDTGGNNQHYGLNPHARNHMTYELFQSLAEQARLAVVDSTTLDWGGVPALDRLSLLVKS
jgi:ubiquinone/menaquinone biosynthesis C-methylase UbiE